MKAAMTVPRGLRAGPSWAAPMTEVVPDGSGWPRPEAGEATENPAEPPVLPPGSLGNWCSGGKEVCRVKVSLKVGAGGACSGQAGLKQ